MYAYHCSARSKIKITEDGEELFKQKIVPLFYYLGNADLSISFRELVK